MRQIMVGIHIGEKHESEPTVDEHAATLQHDDKARDVKHDLYRSAGEHWRGLGRLGKQDRLLQATGGVGAALGVGSLGTSTRCLGMGSKARSCGRMLLRRNHKYFYEPFDGTPDFLAEVKQFSGYHRSAAELAIRSYTAVARPASPLLPGGHHNSHQPPETRANKQKSSS